MGHRLLAWSLWPLGIAVPTSVVVVAGWSDSNSLVRAMGLTSIACILVLVWLEPILPYRPDWSMRGDREIWRDIGHFVLTGTLAHANIAFRIPAFVHRIFVTPEFHRLHHSIDAKQGSSNYATVFPMWDMIFGTHTDPMVAEAREMGIDQDPIPRKFLSELLSPVTFYRLVRNRPHTI